MVRSCSLWLSGGFSLFLITVTLSSGAECLENDLLKETSGDPVLPSQCVVDCTRWTYVRKLETQDTQTIRFTNSEKDDLGHYCWSMPIKCNVGEHLQHAYVVLPVDGSQVAGSLKMTLLPQGDALRPHPRPALLPTSCGIPFDIADHFSGEQRPPELCVQIVPRQSIMGNGVLRCPPFLVTMWQMRQNRPPANQGSG